MSLNSVQKRRISAFTAQTLKVRSDSGNVLAVARNRYSGVYFSFNKNAIHIFKKWTLGLMSQLLLKRPRCISKSLDSLQISLKFWDIKDHFRIGNTDASNLEPSWWLLMLCSGWVRRLNLQTFTIMKNIRIGRIRKENCLGSCICKGKLPGTPALDLQSCLARWAMAASNMLYQFRSLVETYWKEKRVFIGDLCLQSCACRNIHSIKRQRALNRLNPPYAFLLMSFRILLRVMLALWSFEPGGKIQRIYTCCNPADPRCFQSHSQPHPGPKAFFAQSS